jgi:hypothetical protein
MATVVSLTLRPTFTPRKISVRGCVDPRAIVRLEALVHLKIPYSSGLSQSAPTNLATLLFKTTLSHIKFEENEYVKTFLGYWHETIVVQHFPFFIGDKRIQSYIIILQISRVPPDDGLSGPKYVVIEIIGTFVPVTGDTVHFICKCIVPP